MDSSAVVWTTRMCVLLVGILSYDHVTIDYSHPRSVLSRSLFAVKTRAEAAMPGLLLCVHRERERQEVTDMRQKRQEDMVGRTKVRMAKRKRNDVQGIVRKCIPLGVGSHSFPFTRVLCRSTSSQDKGKRQRCESFPAKQPTIKTACAKTYMDQEDGSTDWRMYSTICSRGNPQRKSGDVVSATAAVASSCCCLSFAYECCW